MAELLIVHHSPTASTRALTDSVAAGARDDAISGVETTACAALDVTADHARAADGFVLGTSANFGYMSGALKHFFDQFFLDLGGALSDDGSAGDGPGGRKPYGLWVHGRYDTHGAVRSVQSIVGALPWTQSAPVLQVLGDIGSGDLEQAYELGATIAATLMP